MKFFNKKIVVLLGIVVVLLTLLVGGVFVWKYFWMSKTDGIKNEVSRKNCLVTKNPEGYQELRDQERVNCLGELRIDLNKDGEEEIVKVYVEANPLGIAELPIIVKIFSGPLESLKEEFSYKGEGSEYEVGINSLQGYENFWDDGRNVAVLAARGYGVSNGALNLHSFAYENGKYQEKLILALPAGTDTKYKFNGTNGVANEILVAFPKYSGAGINDEEFECHLCAHRYQFERYDWDGQKYTKTELGITTKKYGPNDSMDFILQSEPSMINETRMPRN